MEQIGGTLLRVLPSPGGGWDVKEPGSSSPVLGHRATEPEAIEAARALLSAGGVVQVIDAEGFVEQTFPVRADQLSSRSSGWWYERKGLQLVYVVIGLPMMVQGVLRFAFRRAEGPTFWWACIQIAAGLAFLVLAIVASRRHRQSLQKAARALVRGWGPAEREPDRTGRNGTKPEGPGGA